MIINGLQEDKILLHVQDVRVIVGNQERKRIGMKVEFWTYVVGVIAGMAIAGLKYPYGTIFSVAVTIIIGMVFWTLRDRIRTDDPVLTDKDRL